jgi:hypothetical protein
VYDVIESELNGRCWLVGEERSAADLLLFMLTEWGSELEPSTWARPNLRAHFERTLELASGLTGRRHVLAGWSGGLRAAGLAESNAMSFAAVLSPNSHIRPTGLKESIMTASYTFDVFSSLDGFGGVRDGSWGGYWGKQGPELLDHRLALYNQDQRMVFGANTYRAFARMLASSTAESEVRDPWVAQMRSLPATVVSTALGGPSTGQARPS